MKLVACRCEDVTLDDLDRSIDQGHRDLESLKRHSGLSTGLCQGKGCLAIGARHLAARGLAVELPTTPRPPVHPAPLALLAGLAALEPRDER